MNPMMQPLRSSSAESRGVNITRIKANAQFPDRVLGTSGYVYNITLVDRAEKRKEDQLSDINLFGTGLVINPDPGYIALITASPQLLKTGYFMPGPVVVAPDTTTELMIPLFKCRETTLDLPYLACRMVLVPNHLVYLKSMNSNPAPQPARKKKFAELPEEEPVEFLY